MRISSWLEDVAEKYPTIEEAKFALGVALELTPSHPIVEKLKQLVYEMEEELPSQEEVPHMRDVVAKEVLEND